MNASTPDRSGRWYARPQTRAWHCTAPGTEPSEFHRSLPDYLPTPLTDCPVLASELGVGRAVVKDESERLGLSAFKLLGASWAVFRAVSARAGGNRVAPTLEALTTLRETAGALTLTTATDGNHGRAVARIASLIGARSRVYVPGDVDPAAVAQISAEGAETEVLDAAYDDVVRHAAEMAGADLDALLVQDTSWPGYEEVPQWIVDGYSTLFAEIDAQLSEQGIGTASLLTVPTGVGSLAQAAVAHHRSTGDDQASLLVVEPESAACVGESLRRGDRVTVPTGRTIMDGLNCGTPSAIAWPYLRDGADTAISVSDDEAQRAQHDLAANGVAAGPCGAASLAGIRAALGGADGEEHREALGLTPDSTVVLLSTDGRR